ncbi:inverse autotransporter beta domain-containing protein [Planctomicrobium sp. SH664]|uniref:inverse autotransporter beta domain-containing protein n=1 Tax=Planctomicrobium sp. SH664 TaxID=3448125 RepID=UPI003F5B2C04
MKLRKACKVGLLSLLLTPIQASAQTFYPEEGGYATLPAANDYTGSMAFGDGYLWARGDMGKRPGVQGDYFSLGTFVPMHIYGPDSLYFIDGEMWVNEQAYVGGDIGLGYRSLVGDSNFALGINNFLTWDTTNDGSSFQRYSIGAEWFTNYLGGSFNAYIPFNTDKENVGGPILTNNSEFRNNNLYFLNQQVVEQQMAGVDGEVGSPIPGIEWLSLYGGAYYFDAHQGEAVRGVSGRAMVDMTCAIFDLSVQNDSTFGTTVNFGAEIRTAGGPFVFAPRWRNLDVKLHERVRKRSRILTQKYTDQVDELAINPNTGLAYTFVHVDNTAGDGGTGTDEDRYDNLGLASGSGTDFILVHRGDTTRANLLQAGDGLTLSDNQIVLGEGVPFLLQTANRPGPVALPDWDQTGSSPFVTANAGRDIITLANNNQVIGLNMISSLNGNMIGGDGIQNFTIRDINTDITPVQTTGSGGGIVLTNATGTGSINRFNFRADNTTTADGGIVIRNVNQPALNLTAQNSSFIEGGVHGVELFANNSLINANLSHLHASENQVGLLLEARNGGSVNSTVADSSFTDAVGLTARNIGVVGQSGGSVNLNGSNVTATGSALDNLSINLQGATGLVALTDSNLDGAADDNVQALTSSNANLTLNLTNTSVDDAQDRALNINAQTSSVVNASLVNSTFDNTVAGDAAGISVASSATVTVNSTGSSFNDAGANGLAVGVNSNGTFNGTFNTSTFDNATNNGVSVSVNTAEANLNLIDSSATGAGNHGLNLNANAGNLVADLRNVALDDAGTNALNINAVSGSDVTVTGDNVSGSGAGNDGIHIISTDSVVSVNLQNLGSFANAGNNGVYASVTGGSEGDFFLGLSGPGGSRADFSGAGNNGLDLNFTNYNGFDGASPLTFEIRDIDFSSAGNNGFQLTSIGDQVAPTPSSFDGLLVNTDLGNSANDSFNAFLNYNPMARVEFIDSIFAPIGGESYDIMADNNTNFTVIFDNTPTPAPFSVIQQNGSVVTTIVE